MELPQPLLRGHLWRWALYLCMRGLSGGGLPAWIPACMDACLPTWLRQPCGSQLRSLAAEHEPSRQQASTASQPTKQAGQADSRAVFLSHGGARRSRARSRGCGPGHCAGTPPSHAVRARGFCSLSPAGRASEDSICTHV